ncbi:MAG: hypothetical protein RLT05_03480, partial [Bauldia litoralis]
PTAARALAKANGPPKRAVLFHVRRGATLSHLRQKHRVDDVNDVKQSNGVIHVIDTVLLPKMG